MTAVVVLVALAGVLIGFCAVAYRSARREVTDYPPKPVVVTQVVEVDRFAESMKRTIETVARATKNLSRLMSNTPVYWQLRDEYERDGRDLP